MNHPATSELIIMHYISVIMCVKQGIHLYFPLQGNIPKCEGCGKTDKLEKFNKFQCGEHKFCEECRNSDLPSASLG